MEVIAVDASDLGNRSYVVTDGYRAMVVDPPRPASAVLDIVRARHLRLDLVVETHLHNDHVSGGPELAAMTGAIYALSAHERVRERGASSTGRPSPSGLSTSRWCRHRATRDTTRLSW